MSRTFVQQPLAGVAVSPSLRRRLQQIELLRLVLDHPASNQRQQEKAAALLDCGPIIKDAPTPYLNTTIIALRTELLDFVTDSSAAKRSP